MLSLGTLYSPECVELEFSEVQPRCVGMGGASAPRLRRSLYRPPSPRKRIRLASISNNMTKATSSAVVE